MLWRQEAEREAARVLGERDDATWDARVAKHKSKGLGI